MNVILLGLPGAGKGTQAKLITESQHIPHISTGDLFRKAVQDQTELGLLAKQYMSKGELVPDEVTIGLALERLEHEDCTSGFLMDGFPRNIAQADALEQYLSSQAKSIDHVIFIDVDERILLERLTGRRVCSGCGASFHITNNPPRVTDRCDHCNEPLIHREDDQEATVQERLRINKELTNTLVDYYRRNGVLRVIEGTQHIATVSNEILSIFAN